MTTSDDDIRPSTPLTRMLLLTASVLVLAMFITLFILTENTDKYFSWTVNPPLTAAFMGAGFGASFFLEFMASRKRTWAETRAGVYGVALFAYLMLLATVMHRDRFHFNADEWYTSIGTWVWLVVYIAVPLMLSVAAFDQWQLAGGDPFSTRPIARPLRLLICLHGLLFVLIGLFLFITPEQTAIVWPWELTPLTARATGSWLVGIGVTIIQLARDGDWEWTKPVSLSYLCFVILIAIAVIRYNGSIDWDEIQIWLLWLLLLIPLLEMGYGWQTSRSER